MSSGYWHCAIDGRQQGPYSVEQLREMATRGAIRPDTLVWTDGMAEWQPLQTTPLYAALVGGAPGPAARTAPPMPAAALDSPGGVGFVDAVKICLSRFVDFNGRASRSEYWWFFLFYFVVLIVASFMDALIKTSILSSLAFLGLILPIIAAAVRRLHDTDRSGWWYLLAFVPIGNIVLIVFLCLQGTQGRNRFG